MFGVAHTRRVPLGYVVLSWYCAVKLTLCQTVLNRSWSAWKLHKLLCKGVCMMRQWGKCAARLYTRFYLPAPQWRKLESAAELVYLISLPKQFRWSTVWQSSFQVSYYQAAELCILDWSATAAYSLTLAVLIICPSASAILFTYCAIFSAMRNTHTVSSLHQNHAWTNSPSSFFQKLHMEGPSSPLESPILHERLGRRWFWVLGRNYRNYGIASMIEKSEKFFRAAKTHR